jgi:hypothetical protein
LKGERPEKKPFGRNAPPAGYPKDQSVYADPENWRYPLHTPWHAKAARRYFDDWPNRAKYTEEERRYIDWRIDEALKKFEARALSNKSKRPPLKIPAKKNIEEMPLNDLLKLFLGAARLARVDEIDDSVVSISKTSSDELAGKVKDYVIEIDLKNRTILHDCQDWRKNIDSKNMCKHLGKFLRTLGNERAANLLRDIIKNREAWRFVAPP